MIQFEKIYKNELDQEAVLDLKNTNTNQNLIKKQETELDHEIDLDLKSTNTNQNNSINCIKNKEDSDNKIVDINKNLIKEPEKEYNLETFNESQELFKELDNHSDSIRRNYEITQDNLEQIYKKIEELKSSGSFKRTDSLNKINKLERLSNRIKKCGYYLVFKEYIDSDKNINKVKLKRANFCGNHHFCLSCAIRRRAKIIRVFHEKLNLIKEDYPDHEIGLLTLTIKNGHNLEERLNHLKKSLSKLRDHGRRTQKNQRGYNSEFGKVIGSITSIEITKDNGYGESKDTGWHIHVHLLIIHDADFNYASFKDEWLRITGDSHVLNLKSINNTDQDFINTLAYMLKPSELTPEENFELFEVSEGRRFLESAGVFRGVKIPKSNIKLELQDLPYLELCFLFDDNRSFYELFEKIHKD
jgi:hypothetical protein